MVSPPHTQDRASSLLALLARPVQAAARGREVDLDLHLAGRPQDLDPAVVNLLAASLDDLLVSVRESAEVHHLGLSLSFEESALRIVLEHDGVLDPGGRESAENAVLEAYNSIGAAGGGISMSLGRGFGLRIELVAPYAGQARVQQGALPGRSPDMLPPFPARSSAGSRGGAQVVERLTPQEEACLALLAAGHSNKEIAARMHISTGTVKYHLAQIYSKLGVQGRGRGTAVARARELGLIFD